MPLDASPPRPARCPSASAHLKALAALGLQRRYRRGTLLIQEGETGDTLYIVLQGRLRAFLSDQRGKELTLATIGTLEFVGEMSLDGGPRSANVEVVEASTCAVISHATVMAYIADQPDFALVLMKRLIRRARMATESARSVALIDVYGRLVRLLDQLADQPDEAGVRLLRERLTHQQLAQHLACSREMVSRLLKDLETGGYIAMRERHICLLRPLPSRW